MFDLLDPDKLIKEALLIVVVALLVGAGVAGGMTYWLSADTPCQCETKERCSGV